MKKYLKLILITSLSTGLLCSCKKDNTPPKPTCRIITASGTGYSGQTNFSYNSEGKLISISAGTLTISLAYSGNTVIAISKETGGAPYYQKQIITLNSNGLALNVRIEADIAGTNWTNDVYEYSGSEVIKNTSTNSAGGTPVIETYTWSGGNLITIKSDRSGTVTLGYYTDKAAQAGDYFSLSQLQAGYQILRNKNAVKSILSGSDIINFDYTIDADGKITSLIATGSSPYSYSYQYQCN
jgi:hypothetical protein